MISFFCVVIVSCGVNFPVIIQFIVIIIGVNNGP